MTPATRVPIFVCLSVSLVLLPVLSFAQNTPTINPKEIQERRDAKVKQTTPRESATPLCTSKGNSCTSDSQCCGELICLFGKCE
jgi:hypothetical protein